MIHFTKNEYVYTKQCLATRSCMTLAVPCTAARQAPLSMGILQARYWSGLPCPPPRDLPNSGTEPRSPALQADSLPSEPLGEPVPNTV